MVLKYKDFGCNKCETSVHMQMKKCQVSKGDLQGLSPLLALSGLPPVMFDQLVRFIAITSQLKNEVLLVQLGSFNEFILEESRQAVLFTMEYGAIPLWLVHLICCNINYHHNFCVHQGQRIDYDGIPDILQIGEHQFAERKLVNMWIMMMLLSWTSATNYQVYDTFTILSLLKDCLLQNQPLKYLDGVSNSHQCCGVPNCNNPLVNNHHRFCPTHSFKRGVCAIVGCSYAVAPEPGRKPCSLEEHEVVEKVHNTCGQAWFQLKEHHRCAQLAHPPDALAYHEVTDPSKIIKDGNIEDTFEFNHKGQPLPVDESSAPTGKRRLHAQFGRNCTHNKQLIAAPCGMIIAWETFYHVEAIYSVIEMIKQTYCISGTKPDHIFFDNNCDPFFCHMGLTVDVFHLKCKHSEKDKFLAEQTNSWFGGYQAMCRKMQVDRYNLTE
ncbi:hypothetical protein B0H34DRAFT_780644 [Crassisporium funariophilum]|nr:hypothetical protein B0H34DRAFT_780644 [Crassisporium funariophilum]